VKVQPQSFIFRAVPSVAYAALCACASAEDDSPGLTTPQPRHVPGPRFPRSSKLLRHADFQRVYKQGRRHFAANMTVFYFRRDDTPMAGPRVGVTVGRVLGGAVERNRIKRRVREAVRASLSGLALPVDIVINPKKSARTVDFAILQKEVARAFDVIRDKESRA